jgi:beta-glucosidase/6-phospho-beta-glucosidase/beta-galactosidase
VARDPVQQVTPEDDRAVAHVRSRGVVLHSLWGAKEIHITENGCATEDELTAEGHVYDTDRIMFLRAYLTQLQRANAEGVPVKGYFQWSTMDNVEWNAGLSGTIRPR